MPIAPLSSVELSYELSGNPSGPVLVLSHALGTDLALWDKQVEGLGKQFYVLRYDTRGHGRSAVPAGEYTLEDLGTDVLHLLDHLEFERAIFCGASLGGITALWLAVHAPHRLNSIIAANTAARIGNAESWSTRMRQVTAEGMMPLIDPAIARWFTAGFLDREPAAGEYARRVLSTTAAAGYGGCSAALRDGDLTDRVGSIQVPVLLITATHDPVTPPPEAHKLQQAIRGASLVELNAGHLSNFEAAPQFNEGVLSWLQRLDDARGGERG